MKLLTKRRDNNRNNPDCDVRIGKTSISVSERLIERHSISTDSYGALGYNDNNQLCLFVQNGFNPDFKKFGTMGDKQSKLYIRLSAADRENTKVFIGDYKSRKTVIKNNLVEITLNTLSHADTK